MEYEFIELDVEAGIATMTLNRPKQLNAINMQMAREVIRACDDLDEDPAVSCLVLRGAGRAFCAGGDLRDADGLSRASTEQLWDGVALWNRMGYRIKTLSVPVIAALHGYVYGAGFLLAVCCDIRVAADDADMAVLLTKPRTFDGKPVVGSAADMGLTWILPRLVGAGRAAELMFLGESVSPAKAERIGLVNDVVAPAELMDEVMTMATKLARGPRLRLKATKKALLASTYDRLSTHMDHEAASQAHMVRAGLEY